MNIQVIHPLYPEAIDRRKQEVMEITLGNNIRNASRERQYDEQSTTLRRFPSSLRRWFRGLLAPA